MKKRLYIAVLCLLSSACKNNAEEKTVDFSDISKPSEKYSRTDSSEEKKEIIPQYFDSISAFSRQFSDSLGYDRKNIVKLDTVIYPDRFGAQKTDKWCYLSPGDSLVFMRWEFVNAVKTENTFFNWLDCYGKNCKSIGIGDKVKFSKRATMFLLGEKDLIFIESGRKIDAEKILRQLESLKKTKRWRFFVLQQPRAAASWKQVDDKGEIRGLTAPEETENK